MTSLRESAVYEVARELARAELKGVIDTPNLHYVWYNKTLEKMDEASEKINTMTNLELLDLIGELLEEEA